MVHLLDAVAICNSELQQVALDVTEHAVADKIGRVFGNDNTFAQMLLCKQFHTLDNRGLRLGDGNNLQQMEVAGWIEKMRTQKVPFEGITAAITDDVDRDSRCIGTDDRIGRGHGFQFCHQLLLGAGPLDNGFNDPVTLLDRSIQIVLHSAEGDQAGPLPTEEIGRPGLCHALETGLDDAVAYGPVSQRKAFGQLVLRQFRRHHIQQMGGDAGIGQMAGYGRAHRTGPNNGHMGDWSVHRDAPSNDDRVSGDQVQQPEEAQN